MQKNMQNMHCFLDRFAKSSCASIGFNDISTENQAVSKRTHAQSSSSRGDSSCWDYGRGTTTLPSRSVLLQIRTICQIPTICQIRTICRKALYVKYTQYVRYAQYIKYAQYVEKAQIAAQYVKYAEYNKKKLIGIQNRLPGFASTPPGTGCHKHIFVVVFSAISGFCPRSYHRSLQLEKPRGGAAGAEVAERPGSAEACAHGFSTEIRSNA